MSNPALLKQTYYPQDDHFGDKFGRLRDTLSAPERPVVVEVKRAVKSRSREAENYLWGVCYPLMADASGYEKHELHDALLRRWFGEVAVEVMGKTVTKPVRTTTTDESGEHAVLAAADYWEFTDFVIREAALWYDVAIPPPDPEKRTR